MYRSLSVIKENIFLQFRVTWFPLWISLSLLSHFHLKAISRTVGKRAASILISSLTATESVGKSDMAQTSILLSCMGPKGRNIYVAFQFDTEEGRLKLDRGLAYCNPRKNITIIGHKFFTCKQQGQAANNYLMVLKQHSSEC